MCVIPSSCSLPVLTLFCKWYPDDTARSSDVVEEEEGPVCEVPSGGTKYLALENAPVETQPDLLLSAVQVEVPALDDTAMDDTPTEQIVVEERSMLACGDLAYVALALNYVKSVSQPDETPD